MLARFIKPKWKHKNPDVRQAAVARLNDQEILLEVANSDPDERTRKSAIGRIDNLPTLLAVHTDPEIQAALNQRLIELLPDAIDEQSQQEAIENYVRVRGGPSLAAALALENPSVRIRTWVIPLLDDSQTLEKMAATDSNAHVRLKAAEQLQDVAAINRTLKLLGRKDKRVTQLLKQKLEEQQSQQKWHQEVEDLIEAMESVGGSDHWQRDNTHFLSLRNQWPSLAEHSSNEQQGRFDAACTQAEARIQTQRKAANAHQPIIEQKESQCQLIENFVGHLEKRHRISTPEAEDVQSTLDTLLADWSDISILPEALEIPLANRFHAQLAKARKLVDMLKQNARSTRDLEHIIGQGEILLRRKQLWEADVSRLIQQWEKQPQPNDNALANEYREHFNQLFQQLKNRIDKQSAQRDKGLEKVEHLLEKIHRNLAQDKLGDSIDLERQIRQILDKISDIPPARLQAIQQQLRDFTPRIRELNGWRHWGTDRVREELIEEAEQLAATPQSPQERAKAVSGLRNRWKQLVTIDHNANRHLWKQFDKACNTAYELCKQHQKEESERRRQNLEARTAICEAIERFSQETDWNAPDWRRVDRDFQQLRNQWNKAGPVSRSDWQKIHKRYQDAVSAINDHLREERQRNHAFRLSLIERLEALVDHEDLPAALAATRQAQREWKPTISNKRSIEQKLWKRFKAAGDAIFAREKSRVDSETSELNTLLEKKTSICEKLEALVENPEKIDQQLSSIKTEWNEIELPRNKNSAELERRFQHTLQSIDFARERLQLEKLRQSIEDEHDLFLTDKNGKEATIDLEATLLDLEILLELPSPPELENARMERKIAKLSARLNERQDQNTLQHSIQLLEKLYHGNQPSALSSKSMERLNTLRDAITGELTREIEELRQS